MHPLEFGFEISDRARIHSSNRFRQTSKKKRTMRKVSRNRAIARQLSARRLNRVSPLTLISTLKSLMLTPFLSSNFKVILTVGINSSDIIGNR